MIKEVNTFEIDPKYRFSFTEWLLAVRLMTIQKKASDLFFSPLFDRLSQFPSVDRETLIKIHESSKRGI